MSHRSLEEDIDGGPVYDCRGCESHWASDGDYVYVLIAGDLGLAVQPFVTQGVFYVGDGKLPFSREAVSVSKNGLLLSIPWVDYTMEPGELTDGPAASTSVQGILRVVVDSATVDFRVPKRGRSGPAGSASE